MKKVRKILLWGLQTAFCTAPLLASCSADDNEVYREVDIVIPTDEDVDCCSLEEEELTIRYLQDLEEVKELSGVQQGIYTLRVYAHTEQLQVGYNELFFTVEKTATGRHVKDVAFSNLVPLMNMKGGTGMQQHSTPTGDFEQVTSWIPVYRTWVSFLMASDDANRWQFSFDYRIKEEHGTVSHPVLTVASLPAGNIHVKSFKVGEDTYYLSLVDANSLRVGVNTLRAYLSKQPAGQEKTRPYFIEQEQAFTIGLNPTMPDMGNHTSPDNEPLRLTEKGYYEGKLNLTMTGRWHIHLTVYDAEGKTVAGDENKHDENGHFYWSVQI